VEEIIHTVQKLFYKEKAVASCGRFFRLVKSLKTMQFNKNLDLINKFLMI